MTETGFKVSSGASVLVAEYMNLGKIPGLLPTTLSLVSAECRVPTVCKVQPLFPLHTIHLHIHLLCS